MLDDVRLKDESHIDEVPTGGTAEGVADDVDAKLSAGEMVIPEDVVRYYGVEYFMKLRDKAKAGFAKMEEMGQVGNSDEVEEEGVDTDQAFNEGDGEIELTDEDFVEAQFDAGGYVKPIVNPNAPPQRQPNAPVPDYTTFMNGAETLKHFINQDGTTMIIPVVQGRLSFNPPQGFKEFDPTNPNDNPFDTGNDNSDPTPDSTPAPAPSVPTNITQNNVNTDVGPDASDGSDGPEGSLGFGGVSFGDGTDTGTLGDLGVVGDLSADSAELGEIGEATSDGIDVSIGLGDIAGVAASLFGGPIAGIAVGRGLNAAGANPTVISGSIGQTHSGLGGGEGDDALGEDSAADIEASLDAQGISMDTADTGTLGDLGVTSDLSAAESEASTDADGGDGGGGARIVCTELVRQGLMPIELHWADARHADLCIPQQTIDGYHWWAKPIVDKLRRDEGKDTLFIRAVTHVATKRAEAVEGTMNGVPFYHHMLGNVYRTIGEPFSWCAGLFVGRQDVKEYA